MFVHSPLSLSQCVRLKFSRCSAEVFRSLSYFAFFFGTPRAGRDNEKNSRLMSYIVCAWLRPAISLCTYGSFQYRNVPVNLYILKTFSVFKKCSCVNARIVEHALLFSRADTEVWLPKFPETNFGNKTRRFGLSEQWQQKKAEKDAKRNTFAPHLPKRAKR